MADVKTTKAGVIAYCIVVILWLMFCHKYVADVINHKFQHRRSLLMADVVTIYSVADVIATKADVIAYFISLFG